MAYQHTHSHHGADIAHSIWSGIKMSVFFVVDIFASISVANQRLHEVERLQAKSDVQLAKLGLRREDIARHVFRDSLYL